MRLRPIAESDVESSVRMWRESRHAAYPWLDHTIHSLADDRAFFRDQILAHCDVWVAEDAGEVVGFMACNGSLLDHLYVRVGRQGEGIGSLLLAKALSISPAPLRLFTFQTNSRARAFYERHGFRAIRFGISPPPENEPDVEYQWHPTAP